MNRLRIPDQAHSNSLPFAGESNFFEWISRRYLRADYAVHRKSIGIINYSLGIGNAADSNFEPFNTK